MPTSSKDGLTVTAHVGDRAVLLAFDIEKSKLENLAGFAVYCKPEHDPGYWLPNRLSFQHAITKDKGLNDDKNQKKYVDSVDAPFQMFHWVHFPPEGAGRYVYEVTARYFESPAKLARGGPKVKLTVDIVDEEMPTLAVGMTRGYVSSQAFIDRYGDDGNELWPKDAKANFDFDTKKYQPRYKYLGAHARELVFAFLKEAKAKRRALDIFAYDFNEPDVVGLIRDIAKNNSVRLYLDDSKTHEAETTPESQIARQLKKLGVKVKRGHFKRFAHDKILIMKSAKGPVKVLTGSANFSLRGLYVQANSVLVFDDEPTARLYGEVFDAVWKDAAGFSKSDLAAKWWPEKEEQHPVLISFAPHKTDWSLQRPADAIKAAQTSVFFAVMAADGGGAVIDGLRDLGARKEVLSMGTIEQSKQVATFKPAVDGNSQVVSFSYLRQHAPPPFHTEVDAGTGMHIHHKFVVCDFNGRTPVVFCGSSNLAKGGEMSNGDNLLAIYDRRVVNAYAIEAIRLFDHYRFRSRQSQATDDKPLQLALHHHWTDDFYDADNMKCRERTLLIQSQSDVLVGDTGPKLTLKTPDAATPSKGKVAVKKKPAIVRAR